jgi:Phosphotransferase enzyme family
VKLDVRVIVPSADGRAIALTADGALPAFETDGDEDEAAIVAIDRVLRGAWSFDAAVLETHPQWAGVPDGAAIPVLVTTERAPTGWTPPAGTIFRDVPQHLETLPESLRPRAREWLDELRTDAPPPRLRPRWARTGWRTRATAWMREAAAAAGRPVADEPRPYYLRGISALLRAPTATGDLFLKAVFPPFHAEPVLTKLLAERFPSHLPEVVAIEPDEGWLLVADIAAGLVSELPDGDRAAAMAAGVRALVEIQSDLAGRTADLAALTASGAPHRPLDALPAALATAIGAEGVAIVDEPIDDARRERATAAVREAAAKVAALGLPETIVHGDFHTGNAALVDRRAVIIDWSDAALASPAIDLVTWITWGRGEIGDVGPAVDAWIDAWAAVADPAALRQGLDDVLVVGAAYQVVSYDGIVRALEPATRYTMAGGASHFLRRLEAVVAGRRRVGR